MKNKLGHTKKQMSMPQGDLEDRQLQLAHAYVLWQYYDTAFSPQEALMKGTLFPELYGPYRVPK